MHDSDKLFNKGKILYNEGNLLSAAEHFEKALILSTATAQSFSNLLLTLNYLIEYDNNTLLKLHKEFDTRYCRPISPTENTFTNIPTHERKLRIGYLSPDFRGHSVAFFIAPVLMHHNHDQFNITAYYNHPQSDKFTLNLRKCCNNWRDISRLTDDQVAKLIRKDEIDILIDLAGHSAYNRLTVFARRPAPIQVTWLGYPNTTGISCIDYRLTDTLTDPAPEDQQDISEQLFHLPDTFLCYSPLRKCPDISPLPATKNRYTTFGSLNNFAKINPDVIAAWITLLQMKPDSRLILVYNGCKKEWLDKTIHHAKSCAEIPFAALRSMGHLLYARKAFEVHGITQDRITIFNRSDSNDIHLLRYHNIDIALDPFPYNGTTTTYESLWMGVPVISLEGNRHATRVSASIIKILGLKDLVGKDTDSYIYAACNLSDDKTRLSSLRSELRSTMSTSKLMDASNFTRNLESAYHIMWKRWCNTH